MRNFFLIKYHPRGLPGVYQENSRQKCNLPDTRTIVPSLSNVKCRVVFWFFPLRRWRRTLAVSRARKPERSVGCRASAPLRGSALLEKGRSPLLLVRCRRRLHFPTTLTSGPPLPAPPGAPLHSLHGVSSSPPTPLQGLSQAVPDPCAAPVPHTPGSKADSRKNPAVAPPASNLR